MKSAEIYSEVFQQQCVLRDRLRVAGIVLVSCDAAGQIVACTDEMTNQAAAAHERDWLTDLLVRSPLFAMLLANAAQQWAEQLEPAVLEPAPGLVLAPMPLSIRRRRVGYSVAVIFTSAILEAEQLAAMCQAAEQDLELCRCMIAALPPVSPNEVGRLVSLVRFAHEDHARLLSSGQAVERVGEQLAESYEEMTLLYNIIQSMTVRERPERFAALLCRELLGTLPYNWIGLQFASDRRRLRHLTGRLILAGQTDRNETQSQVRSASVQSPDNASSASNGSGRQSHRQFRDAVKALLEATLGSDPNTPVVLEPDSNPHHAAFAVLGNSVVAHPIASDDEIVGLLIAGNKNDGDPAASSVDIKLLGAAATHMAIFLENAALYEDLNSMFLGTLEALTASIDAKDRYTCGHSRRVAHLTRQLAEAIGLDQRTVERMHIAGLVHDVGKIGVPEAVLLKPGKLNDEEFAWIRQHPEIGYRILKDIPQLHDILPGVLHHHERWDGKGYPAGLRGEQIPLVARLIGLADSFDAMSSNRTYRPAMSHAQVLQEITRCIGEQFDPELARVFVTLDFTAYDQLVREHQAREMRELRRQEEAA